MLSLFRDVTAQRRLEEQLRQSQKMEAIGQLAGGVAHDFNNILTVIHGHASLSGECPIWMTPARRSAQQITQAAERAAGLTRQLLAFSRRQLIQPKQLDMNEIVGNMTDMLGRLLGEDIALQLNYCQSPATIEADSGMMEQVLLNLAVNARDAMPRGGQLAIRIAIVEVDEAHVRAPARGADRAFRLPQQVRHRLRHSAGKSSRAFSNRFSPPRKSAKAPASAWPPFTASSNSIRAGSKSKAPSAKAPPSAFTSRSSASQQSEVGKTRRRRSPCAAATKPFCSSKTNVPCANWSPASSRNTATKSCRPAPASMRSASGEEHKR